jgi:hypothetical protein
LLLQEGVRCPADAAAWPTRPIGFGECMVVEQDFGADAGQAAASPQAGAGVLGR